MTRSHLRKLWSCLIVAILLGAQPAAAQTYVKAVAVPPAAAAQGVSPVVANPAIGGLSSPMNFSGMTPSLGQGASLNAIPGASIESMPESFIIGVANSAEAQMAPAETPIAATPLESVQKLSEAVTPNEAGEAKSAQEIRGATAKFYDQNVAAPQDAAAVSAEAAFQAAQEISALSSRETSRLGKLYPKVVFLQDVFTGPASEPAVAFVDKLLNEGVRVVFLTSRSLKGKNGAEEVLLSKLKNRRTNPVIIASHNGGKITKQSRAKAPKSMIPDVSAFTPENIEAFESVATKVERTLKLPIGALKQSAVSDYNDAAFAYSVELPRSVPASQTKVMLGRMIRSFHARLKTAGLPYKMEQDPTNPRAAVMHSMPMRFAVPRVLEALKAEFPEDRLETSPEKFLVLANSQKSPKYAASFPKGVEVQAVGSEASLVETLGAVLGHRTLPSVSLKLGKLRQYVEYWEPVHRLSPSGRPFFSGSKSGSGGGGNKTPVDQKLAMFTGGVLYNLMAYIYDQTWQGQHNMVRLSVLQAKLRSMWYYPLKNNVYVNKGLAKVMQTPAWKARQRGYLEKANAFLTNFYLREFGDYTAGARNVQENLVGLATFRNSLITLEFESASTNKLYRIHTRIPRVMKSDTSVGRVLTAHSYRTGKEAPDDGEQLLAQTLAMALLRGYGRVGTDGKWHHGAADGPVLAEVRVQLEYMSSHRSIVFKPEELLRIVQVDGKNARTSEYDVIQGPVAQQVTSAIERMEADLEYQEHYKEQEQKATPQDLKKKRKKRTTTAKSKPAVKKPAKKTTRRNG